jgi:sugar lactone lactonase YvrE
MLHRHPKPRETHDVDANADFTIPTYTIATVAGGGPALGQAGLSIAIGQPFYLATDQIGNLYLSARLLNQVFLFDPLGDLGFVIGNGTVGFSGDGGPASAAQLNNPQGLAIDYNGNLFIADTGNQRIRKVDFQSRTISTVAGTGQAGYSGDGGMGTFAALNNPGNLAVDRSGNLYIGDDSNSRIRVMVISGVIFTYAGIGTYGYSGDGGPASAAKISSGFGLAVDNSGNLYLSDGPRIRVVSAADQIITTVAGTGVSGYSGDGGQAVLARLNQPHQISFDLAGFLYVADYGNFRIRRIAPDGIITTVAGVGRYGQSGDGGPAVNAELAPPFGVAADYQQNFYVTNYQTVRKVDSSTGLISEFAGNGSMYVGADSVAASNAQLGLAVTVAIDADGSFFIGSLSAPEVRRVDAGTGIISLVAGNGTSGFSGDGGLATAAQLNSVYGVALDAAGNLYIADRGNSRVRMVAVDTGIITTVAGNGTFYNGDNLPAVDAGLDPAGIAVDSAGNIYIADLSDQRVRKITAATGVITTVAGNGSGGYTGDSGPAVNAELNGPTCVAVDSTGNVFVTDKNNERVRRIDAGTGIITTVAGSGKAGYSGDGAAALNAKFYGMSGIAVDAAGNLYIADQNNQRIRRVDVASGLVTTIAGTGTQGFSGDGGPAQSAQVKSPYGVSTDAAGNVWITDTLNVRIRKLTASS